MFITWWLTDCLNGSVLRTTPVVILMVGGLPISANYEVTCCGDSSIIRHSPT